MSIESWTSKDFIIMVFLFIFLQLDCYRGLESGLILLVSTTSYTSSVSSMLA